MNGFDPGSFLAGASVVLLALLVLDFVLAGGAISMGMMGGIGGTMGTPLGWVLLVVLVAILVATFAGPFR
ncbi:MAG: hypothetical protein HYX56_07585 [Chloroflexi bacterium]|nr:hypothetical protein [Chloroflexota bacterium]